MENIEQIVTILEHFQKEQQKMKNDIDSLYNIVKECLSLQKNNTLDMNKGTSGVKTYDRWSRY